MCYVTLSCEVSGHYIASVFVFLFANTLADLTCFFALSDFRFLFMTSACRDNQRYHKKLPSVLYCEFVNYILLKTKMNFVANYATEILILVVVFFLFRTGFAVGFSCLYYVKRVKCLVHNFVIKHLNDIETIGSLNCCGWN